MNPTTMTRYELVQALRSFVSPRNYQRLTHAPTAVLRAALAFHSSPKSERPDGEVSFLIELPLHG